MRILITGGAGFIGSHLAETCLGDGNEVTVLDNLSTGRKKNLAAIWANPRFHFVEGNVLDSVLVESLIENSDLVYHLAAAVGVRTAIQAPLHTLTLNFQGTQTILQSCSRHQKKVLLASSSEVYGKNPKSTFSESDPLFLGPPSIGRWSYACAKVLDEFLAFAHAKEHGLRFVILRYFNIIGSRQLPHHGMVVPRFITQALQNKPLTLFGDGHQSRCFLHVADAVEVTHQLAGLSSAEQQMINIGNTQPITILELARSVIRITGSHSGIQSINPQEIYGQDFEDTAMRVPNITQLKQLTGFSPKHTLKQAIQDAIKELSLSGTSGNSDGLRENAIGWMARSEGGESPKVGL